MYSFRYRIFFVIVGVENNLILHLTLTFVVWRTRAVIHHAMLLHFRHIYEPNKDKTSCKFYKILLHRVLQTEDLDCKENVIIEGDFNCPLNPKLDNKGGVMVEKWL